MMRDFSPAHVNDLMEACNQHDDQYYPVEKVRKWTNSVDERCPELGRLDSYKSFAGAARRKGARFKASDLELLVRGMAKSLEDAKAANMKEFLSEIEANVDYKIGRRCTATDLLLLSLWLEKNWYAESVRNQSVDFFIGLIGYVRLNGDQGYLSPDDLALLRQVKDEQRRRADGELTKLVLSSDTEQYLDALRAAIDQIENVFGSTTPTRQVFELHSSTPCHDVHMSGLGVRDERGVKVVFTELRIEVRQPKS